MPTAEFVPRPGAFFNRCGLGLPHSAKTPPGSMVGQRSARSSSFSKIEIHRPQGFKNPRELHRSHPTQHNANSDRDFRGHPRSHTLCRRSKRDITISPATRDPAHIFPATLALLGLSHRPGYHPFGPPRMSKNTQLRPLSSFGKNEM